MPSMTETSAPINITSRKFYFQCFYAAYLFNNIIFSLSLLQPVLYGNNSYVISYMKLN